MNLAMVTHQKPRNFPTNWKKIVAFLDKISAKRAQQKKTKAAELNTKLLFFWFKYLACMW